MRPSSTRATHAAEHCYDVAVPLLSHVASSSSTSTHTSGSQAAFRNVLASVADAAASKYVHVAPTEGYERCTSAPWRPFSALIENLSPDVSIVAPIAVRISMCRFTGRLLLLPIAHPPGQAIATLPQRARRGPTWCMEATLKFASSLA